MRPLLSSIGSFSHERAVWLSKILTTLRHHQATVKDSFEFLQRVSNLSASDNIMASLEFRCKELIHECFGLLHHRSGS